MAPVSPREEKKIHACIPLGGPETTHLAVVDLAGALAASPLLASSPGQTPTAGWIWKIVIHKIRNLHRGLDYWELVYIRFEPPTAGWILGIGIHKIPPRAGYGESVYIRFEKHELDIENIF